MPSLANHIRRTLAEAQECLAADEIAERLNREFPGTVYTESEIQGKLVIMPNVRKSGTKYCLKPEDDSQAAARIVREATEQK
jgi:hypothetical protein